LCGHVEITTLNAINYNKRVCVPFGFLEEKYISKT
jgi:hypothetical protein